MQIQTTIVARLMFVLIRPSHWGLGKIVRIVSPMYVILHRLGKQHSLGYQHPLKNVQNRTIQSEDGILNSNQRYLKKIFEKDI